MSNTDADLQLPLATNFNYYSTRDFHSSEDVQSPFSNKTFSAFHHNANFDSLHQLLIDLIKSFSIIGLSETKIRHGKDQILNTNMTGYHFLSQPTLSEAGGDGIFIKDNLSYIQRSQFCRSEHEFESLFVEIEIPNQHNIICGVIYRHPKAQLQNMLDFVHNTVDKINKENKYCLLLSDFNIDLLKFDSHPGTEEFINPRSLEGGGGGVKLTPPPSIFLALNFYSLTDYEKLWHNCSLFVNTSFDTN